MFFLSTLEKHCSISPNIALHNLQKSTGIFVFTPLYVMSFFLRLLLRFSPLLLILSNLIMKCLEVHWTSLIFGFVFTKLGKFFPIISSNIFSTPPSFSPPLGNLITYILGSLKLSESLLMLFIFLQYFSSVHFILDRLHSISLLLSSAVSNTLLVSSVYFHLGYCSFHL